jgi:hypothetical protein
MKQLTTIVAMLVSISLHATIMGFDGWEVGFTNPAAAITNATLSEPDKFLGTTNGLGWGKGETNLYRDFWIQGIPIAIGTSWRPARAATVTVEVDSTSNDTSPCFIRYSPDKKHWSSWQALDQHHGVIEVPRSVSGDYDRLWGNIQKWMCPGVAMKRPR